MTKLLDDPLGRVRKLRPDMQDDIARMLIAYLGDGEPLAELTPEEEASFDKSFAQAERGDFATDEQVRAVWSKHGL